MAGDGDLTSTFRARAIFMKTWKAASPPSNRDRLELYALHKQAVSGDAPTTFSTAASAPERAKYQAWRAKSGLSSQDAMRLYVQESDRQLRVYGTSNPQTPETTPTSGNTSNNNNNNNNNNNRNNQDSIPRGLAAIPLLCAAAAESRPAYIRRMSQTPLENAWWKRQEALCGGDSDSLSSSSVNNNSTTTATGTSSSSSTSLTSSLLSIPETILIQLARMIEYWSIMSSSKVITALLWPLHNSLLSIWIACIVLLQVLESVWEIIQVFVWGARRTGLTLQTILEKRLIITGQSVNSMAAPHQALSCRLIGLMLCPLPLILRMILPTALLYSSSNGISASSNATAASSNNNSGGTIPLTLTSVVLVMILGSTWWYWLIVVPWLATSMLGIALSSGTCFALIEFADGI